MLFFISLHPRLTRQVLFIHSVAGGLHGHLQHSDAAIVGGQHNLIWCAPVDVEDAVVHVATDARAADHLNLWERGVEGVQLKVSPWGFVYSICKSPGRW